VSEPIDRTLPTAAAAPARRPEPQAGSAREDSPAFRRLLESLQRLARPAEPPAEVHDTETLKRALADADDGYQQVMDLRRKLEEAFRQRSQ
jgi:hypothetical protein